MAAFPFTVPLLAIIGVTAGVQVGPIHLIQNYTYITYGMPSPEYSVIQCPYTLQEDETVDFISWALWSGEDAVGTYVWSPVELGKSNGSLSGVVNVSREDGDLEFTDLRYDLGGFYSCSVTTTTGETADSEKWEVLIIDTTSNTMSQGFENIIGSPCTLDTSARLYAVFPEPTPHAGLYSETSGGFYDEVTDSQWDKVIYPNTSVAYSFSNVLFQFDEDTPYDVEFALTYGVTKTDGSLIPLITTTTDVFAWNIQGCPAMLNVTNQVEEYSEGRKTCRNEYVPKEGVPQVSVTCVEGYHSETVVTPLVLFCDSETFHWVTEDGENMTDVDLQCLPDE
nr:uncharacterized protein LOC123769158 [Procambarus clarkii]